MFEPLYNVTEINAYVIILNTLAFSFITSILLLVISFFLKGKVYMVVSNIMFSTLALGILCVVALNVTVLIAENVDSHAALENNLKQKYDIEQVIEDDKYQIDTTLETDQFIQVETTDGRKAVFTLTQDMDTFEPTLSELVDNGAAGPVTLEEITK